MNGLAFDILLLIELLDSDSINLALKHCVLVL